jgi:hypothetical protein
MIKKDRRSCLFIKKEQQQREKRVKDFYIYNNKVYIKMEKPNIITRRKIYHIYIYMITLKMNHSPFACISHNAL